MEKAVAIRYNEDLPAPFVLARGRGELARRLVQIARQHDIRVVEMPDLTDALVELPEGTFIPEELYQIVAELLVFVRDLGSR